MDYYCTCKPNFLNQGIYYIKVLLWEDFAFFLEGSCSAVFKLSDQSNASILFVINFLIFILYYSLGYISLRFVRWIAFCHDEGKVFNVITLGPWFPFQDWGIRTQGLDYIKFCFFTSAFACRTVLVENTQKTVLFSQPGLPQYSW